MIKITGLTTSLYYKEKNIVLYNDNCLNIMKKLPNDYVDLVVTDPPYALKFMGKDWDRTLPPISTWKECLRVLKPGAFAFIMSAPRQDVLSRMIYNLQEAGFETGFSSIYWSYATGFPKASNISKMADKRGAILPDDLRRFKGWFRKQIENSTKTQQQINKECGFTATSYYKTDGKDYWTSAFPTKEKWIKIKQVMSFSNKWDSLLKRYDKERGFIEPTGNLHQADKTKSIKFSGKQLSNNPYSNRAKKLDGSYGGFQPKPAVEIIIVAMKPLSEKTYVDQALKNGKGITWLDNCRVPYESENDKPNETERGSPIAQQTTGNSVTGWNKKDYKGKFNPDSKGRFPANLLVSNDVLNDGKISKSGQNNIRRKEGTFVQHKLGGKDTKQVSYSDKGSYSRYFDLDKWWIERVKKLPPEVQKVFPYLIVAKASKGEKNKGLVEKGTGSNTYNRKCLSCGKWQRKQGLTDDYTCHCKRPDWEKPKGNLHPTVKPLKLMSYLITLGSREKEIVLDPFTGSGTTLIASKLLNRKGIGIEMSREYCNIAKARVKGWSK